MAIEMRNGKPYYYTSRRVGARVKLRPPTPSVDDPLELGHATVSGVEGQRARVLAVDGHGPTSLFG